eukprot:EG_transcript_16067
MSVGTLAAAQWLPPLATYDGSLLGGYYFPPPSPPYFPPNSGDTDLTLWLERGPLADVLPPSDLSTAPDVRPWLPSNVLPHLFPEHRRPFIRVQVVGPHGKPLLRDPQDAEALDRAQRRGDLAWLAQRCPHLCPAGQRGESPDAGVAGPADTVVLKVVGCVRCCLADEGDEGFARQADPAWE